MNSPLKAAVVGLGFMGRTHTEALRRVRVEVAGVLGITPEEGRAFAEQMVVPQVYARYEDVLADQDVQVVHLCTPNYLHYDMAHQALLAGKHVVCEKPLANTSEQACELAELARSRGLIGAVNYNLRFYPLNLEARARVQSGSIGEVRLMHGEYTQDWLLLESDWNWRLEPEQGGTLRAVADIGTHWLDLVTWVSGLEISAVMADMRTFLPVRYRPDREAETFGGKLAGTQHGTPVEILTEDFAGVLLRFSNGARGVLTLSQVNPGRKNHFAWEINGAQQSLAWDQETPNQLWVGHRDRPNELVLKDPALMQADMRAFAGYPGGHAEGYPDTFAQSFGAIYRAVTAGSGREKPLFATFDDGWQELVLCDAILESARQERWVDVRY